jgi:hypothetical protein
MVKTCRSLKNNYKENSMLDSYSGLIKALNASSAAIIVVLDGMDYPELRLFSVYAMYMMIE